MKRNLILTALALVVLAGSFFLFWGLAESVLAGIPRLKEEASDLALAGSITLTLVVLLSVNRVLRGKR
jgi:hypothetical protein